MRRRLPLCGAAIALAAAGGAALAMDPPHDGVAVSGITTPVGCTSCHVHSGPGTGYTANASQANLCNSCHANATTGRFGWPWTSTDQAVPGAGGDHHRWDAPAASADHEAVVPDPASNPALSTLLQGMATRITGNGGNLSCSVCHDEHVGNVVSSGNGGYVTDGWPSAGTLHLSPVTHVGAGSGVVTSSLAVPGSTPPQKSYTIQIVAGGAPGAATFQASYDNGLTFQPAQPTATSAVALNGDAGVTVAFPSGSFVSGDTYAFYLSYPMLRYPNQLSGHGSALCKACHPARFQSNVRARGEDPAYPANGVNLFSHPVDEVFGNNAYGADDWGNGCSGVANCQGRILDAGGANQGAAMPASQVLGLDAAGAVHCMSCHYPHGADSSSLSVSSR